MRFLRSNTATIVTVGPFIDLADGVTPMITLTVTNDWLTLAIDDDTGGTAPTLALDVAPTASGGGVNDMVVLTSGINGYYTLELTAANLNYTGRASLTIHDTDVHLPVFHEYQILPEETYDAMFSGTPTWLTNLTASASAIITGTAITGTLTATSFTTSLTTGYATDELVNRSIVFYDDASNAGCAGVITSSSSGGLIGITSGIATAPANTDKFVIV